MISIASIFTAPITTQYPAPTQESLEQIALGSEPCIIHPSTNLLPLNTYYKDGWSGTNSQMYTRRAVLERLHAIADMLKPDFGLLLFDIYRSVETQMALFTYFHQLIKKNNPNWDEAKIMQETRKYISDPQDKARFEVLPHNSGGAVDLAIYDVKTQIALNFGSEFDEVSDKSRTDFFEQEYHPDFGFSSNEWHEIQRNRRILFNLMKHVGFTNYAAEWWHYDLGDCMWAAILNCNWIFGAMEI